MEDLVTLGDLDLTTSCPQCGRAYIHRGCETDEDVTTMNGMTLWSVFEACMIPACDWSEITANVKIGV